MKPLAIPKKPRHTANLAENTDSIQDVLDKQRAKKTAVAEVRLDQIEINFNVKNLQAVLDKAMLAYFPELPRTMVTAKPFGVMRKRMKEAGLLGKVNDFIDVIVRDWRNISANSRASYMKDTSKPGAPIPDVPSFDTLAYRLPYFIKVYASASSRPVEASDPTKALRKQVANLTDQLQQERKSTAAVLRRTRRPASQPPEVRRVVTTRTIMAGVVPPTVRSEDDLPPDDIPEWVDRKNK